MLIKRNMLYAGLISILFFNVILQAQDSTSLIKSYDSLIVDVKNDTLSVPDSQESDSSKEIEKIKIVRRKYKFREQIGSAIGMMLFVAAILITVQNWNPD